MNQLSMESKLGAEGRDPAAQRLEGFGGVLIDFADSDKSATTLRAEHEELFREAIYRKVGLPPVRATIPEIRRSQ